MLPSNSAFYTPDPRDYNFGELYQHWGADIDLPKKFIADDNDYQNQWLLEFTKNACGSFTLAHCVNANNLMEWSLAGNKKFGKDLWSRQIKAPYRGTLENWSWLHDNLKQWQDEKLISGYVKIQNLIQFKQALAINKQAVYSGTNQCDWKATRLSHTFTWVKEGPGHFFAIIGYDDEKWVAIAKNSYGPKRSGNGQFEIPYKYLFDNLFGLYALVDMADEALIKQKKDELNLAKAQQLGIWNGSEPDQPISRKHVVMVAMRTADYVLSEVKKMLWQSGADSTETWV